MKPAHRVTAAPADLAAWRWLVLSRRPAAVQRWDRWLRRTLGLRPAVVTDLGVDLLQHAGPVAVCVGEPALLVARLPAWASRVPVLWLADPAHAIEAQAARLFGVVVEIEFAGELEPADWHERLREGAREADLQARVCAEQTTAWEFALPTDPSLVPAAIELVERRLRDGVRGNGPAIRKVCMALEEAVFNALSHGNLEIGSDIRQVNEAEYHALIRERCQTRPYCERKVRVLCRIEGGRIEVAVEDDGKGFDPSTVPDPTAEERLDVVGGRGLLLIRSLMDEVRFNERGNRVTMVKRIGG